MNKAAATTQGIAKDNICGKKHAYDFMFKSMVICEAKHAYYLFKTMVISSIYSRVYLW
jgi:hypothetical protein